MRQKARTAAGVASGSESGRVIAWRRELLCGAGFDRRLADELAADRAIDLHALLELVDGGCPPELAVRILAPLDRERRW